MRCNDFEVAVKEKLGVTDVIWSVKFLDVPPPRPVAVIVYSVAACTVVGVPDNKPLVVLNVKPAGAAGEIE